MELSKYVINLTDRKDRRVDMNRQLARVGWHAQFSNSDRPNPGLDGFPSMGAKGCFMSHLHTLRRGRTMKGSHVLIMEDDLNFYPGFASAWSRAIEDLEHHDWSVFYAGHDLNLSQGLTELDPQTGVQGAHLVMFNANVVANFIEGLETILSRPEGHPDGGPMHVDGAYSTIRKQNRDMRTFAISPPLGHQRPSRSDIMDVRLYDRVRALRPAVRVLRKMKEKF